MSLDWLIIILGIVTEVMRTVSGLKTVFLGLVVLLGIPSLPLAVTGGFSERTYPVGLLYEQYGHEFNRHSESTVLTGGAAAGDFDGDGWVDLFVTRLDNTDILFRNLGADRASDDPWFEDVTSDAGLSVDDSTNGAAWGDIDNDGDLDLFVTVIEAPRFYLYVNQGDGTFKEEGITRGAALESKVDHNGFSAAFGDYDRDGWLDIHICEWGIEEENVDVTVHSALLRNLGEEAPGSFENVNLSAGVVPVASPLYMFSSSFSDLDGDGWPDLAIASDFQTSQLYWNNGDGTFSDGTTTAGIRKSTSEMGSTIGDLDQDGLLDWFVTTIEDNRLYRNLGDRTFSEEAGEMDLQNAGWGWGTRMFDMDNDGDLDIIMTNGYHPHSATPEEYYANEGIERDVMRLWRNDSGVFTDVSSELGIRDDGEGKGLVVFDFDNDGDLDVFVVNTGENPTLYLNEIENDNAWLRLDLVGTASNSQGIGTRIKVIAEEGAEPRIYEMTGANNYLGQSEDILHLGLGQLSRPVHRLELYWPSGKNEVLTEVGLNQVLTLVEPVPFTYKDWVAQTFEESEMEDPGIVAPEADPEDDGLNNLLEYAFGLSTHNFDTDLPYSFFGTKEEGYYRLEYSRVKSADDLDFLFEVSTDLLSWSPIVPLSETVHPGTKNDQVEIEFSRSDTFFLQIRVMLSQ